MIQVAQPSKGQRPVLPSRGPGTGSGPAPGPHSHHRPVSGKHQGGALGSRARDSQHPPTCCTQGPRGRAPPPGVGKFPSTRGRSAGHGCPCKVLSHQGSAAWVPPEISGPQAAALYEQTGRAWQEASYSQRLCRLPGKATGDAKPAVERLPQTAWGPEEI